MHKVLGIDTSNYTTSAALFHWQDGTVRHVKKLLPVKSGQLGLRQSDAVFHHVQQLPELLEELLAGEGTPKALGVSTRPRDAEGSYMPCFTVGGGAAKILSSAWKIPLFAFSHQAGHIAAALYSAGRLDLLEKRFLAFHVSGGTTEAVIVNGETKQRFSIRLAAKTLDLNAGQAVDRVGGLLGLPFPAGPHLEKLALAYPRGVKVKPVLKGCDCCLSGVENMCARMLAEGEPKEKIARFCIDDIAATLEMMCEKLLKEFGHLPVLFAGGVMSNQMIRESFTKKFHALFAEPEFSADNAAGIAVLAARKAGWLCS